MKTKNHQQNNHSWSQYWPLFSLVGVSLFAAFALTYGMEGVFYDWVHYFMGFFLTSFALLKIFQPEAFADGFQQYDIIAKRSRAYAYVYPYIELFLGLSFFAFTFPFLTYLITFIIMGISAIGVVTALQNKMKIKCACMGNFLNVPLSKVTLTEDVFMGFMALFMLFTL